MSVCEPRRGESIQMFNPHCCQNLCSNSSPCFPVTKPFPDKTQNFIQLWGFWLFFFGGGGGVKAQNCFINASKFVNGYKGSISTGI